MATAKLRFSLFIIPVSLFIALSWSDSLAQISADPAAANGTPAPEPQRSTLRDYSKPHRAFPAILAPYRSEDVPAPDLNNTPRLEPLIQNGKLMLSMNDAVALALENNLDIAISRYNLNIADTDILRANAGSTILGVNAGVVQNTPGGATGGLSGTVGSGVGGTSVGSAGVGTGTNGLVNSTLGIGAPITSFDPIVAGTLQMDRNHVLSASSFSLPVTAQNTATANFSYLQGLHLGTNLSVGFNNTRVTTDSPFTALSPDLNSNFQFRVTQPLLQGFGSLPNTRFIRIAAHNREISDVAFRLQLITTVDQIENMYWNLVYAFEDVKVQLEALAFAQKTLSDNQKQVQIGLLPPIQIVNAQSTVANNQQALILAQNNLQLQQLLMKNALSRTLDDPRLASLEIIPTSTMQIPAKEPEGSALELTNDALGHRAELTESRIDLATRDINNGAVRNALLPVVDPFVYYGGSGLGGVQNPANICPAPPATKTFGCHAAGSLSTVGYGGTLNDLVNSAASDKGAGITLNVILRNRAAQANQIRAQLEYRQAQVRLQQIENQIRIEVANAEFSLAQNRASVAAAQSAADYAKQTLYTEQKRLEAGLSNPTLVLQQQSAYTGAQSNLVSAMAAYEKARVELDRATGLLLERTGIVVAEAERAQIKHMPNVPEIAPSNPQPAP